MEARKEIAVADLPDEVRKHVNVVAALTIKIARERGDPEAHKEIARAFANAWEAGRIYDTD